MELLRQVISDNKNFTHTAIYEKLREGQTPEITLVMCSDSRVPTSVAKENTINSVFTIENIGNQVKTAEGSVDYGVLHLNTPMLLILGHTQCGAVKACLGDYSQETDGIRRELDFLNSALSEMGHSFDKEDSKKIDKFAELNVDYQIGYALKKYKDKVENNELTLVGMMLDFTESYSDEKCRLHITNVNGKTATEDITQEIGEEFKENIRRLVQ